MTILGINHSNDAAAALVEEGRVTAAIAEERLSRHKHDAAFPARAIETVLQTGGRALADCDAAAFFWNPVVQMDAPHARLCATPRSQLEFLYSLPNQLLSGRADLGRLPFAELRLPGADRPDRLYFVTHHLCHAAHAFFESPFDEAAILTVDGYGERASTLIALGGGGDPTAIEPLVEVRFPHSVGSVYAAVTQFLGFRANSGEGKVMGLAPYGDPSRYAGLFERLLRTTSDGFEVDLSYFAYYTDGRARFSERLVTELGEPRRPESPVEKRDEDVAAALQARTEEVVLHLAALARERTGLDQLCMAGGVALNCVANGRIVNEAGFERCFFQPACHDAGTSAGAALYAHHLIEGRPRSEISVKTDYLGPSFDEDRLRLALDRAGARFSEPKDPAAAVAELLAQGRIVGRFDGRTEFGPRALGNRSILAPPGPAKVKDTLNARVKFREPFRPFAPSCTVERGGDYFALNQPSPFMLRAFDTREHWRDKLAAITHVDGSARVQTVEAGDNPGYHALIKAYGALAGHECVLNTSFNIRGEPIVNTPEEALRCFFSTDMDDLLLGPFLLEKG